MNFFRTHRSPIAWMLYAFILFNGLACAIGHGQMMGAFSAKAAAPSHHEHHGGSSMSGMDHDMSAEAPMDMSGKNMAMPGSMQSLFGDCSFAGTLTLAMIFFVALSWLIRTRNPRFIFPSLWSGRASRQCFPGLNPQAP
jgi:ascorbate-specific PTS system EIIC-type component UlaA